MKKIRFVMVFALLVITAFSVISCKKRAEEKSEEEPCNHWVSDWYVVTAATENEAGFEEAVCRDCGEVVQQNITYTIHNMGEWTRIKEPTCTEDGIEERSCEDWDCQIREQRKVPAAHDMNEWKITKEPTCTEVGTEEADCAVCGTKEERKVSPPSRYGRMGNS